MNAVCAQRWKGQSTAGAGVRVILTSSCPSAQEWGRSLSAAAEDPGGSRRRKVGVLVGGAQLQCWDSTTSCWSNSRAQAIFPFETFEIETRSHKKGARSPFSKC